jgi:hypothetical protein
MRHTRIYNAQECELSSIPPEGLEDLWPQVKTLMAHVQSVREDENALQQQQFGMIRDGCFLMPSPHLSGSADVCRNSWFHEYQFYFKFNSDAYDSYFWVSGLLDRGYSLDTLWFPERRIAITNYIPGIDSLRLARFEELLTGPVVKRAWSNETDAPRTAIVGFQHMMHMLWNELPALDRLTAWEMPASFDIAVQCEPFGPTGVLFPELIPKIRKIRYEDILRENADHGLVIGLGSWTITRQTQQRVLRAATQYTHPSTLSSVSRFAQMHHPVFWISVKPPKRTLHKQVETIVFLIEFLLDKYPSAGFILDGASVPWDLKCNSNYPQWFFDFADRATANSAVIIEKIFKNCRFSARSRIKCLNAIDVCEEIMWGTIVTFYICHGGTMQNKIGWLHNIPGFIHSNREFLFHYRHMPPPVQEGPPCYFSSEHIIIDDMPDGYTELELARKDLNYRVKSDAAFAQEVLESFRASRREGEATIVPEIERSTNERN